MYFPLGWPKVLKTEELGQGIIKQIKCNRDRILFSIITDDSLAIWFCKVSLRLGIENLLIRAFFNSLVFLSLFSVVQKNH